MPQRPPRYQISDQPAPQRRPPDRRPSAARRLYGHRWRKESRLFLAQHPLCECDECMASGRRSASAVVDHDPPHRGDLAAFWDMARWRAMAKRCHDRKTASRDGGFGRHSGGMVKPGGFAP